MVGSYSEAARQYGSQQKAAAALGIPRTTFRRKYHAECKREARLDAHPARRGLARAMDESFMFADTHNGLPDAFMGIFGARRAEKIACTHNKKRILCVSDLHCGHRVGLTPPGWWRGEEEPLQREMWTWFERTVKEQGPFDACFDLGDNIDGAGSRSGGVELITRDLLEQVEMATQCLRVIPTEQFVMVYGTPYHVSLEGTDMERQIAENLGGAIISGHEWVDVNGCVFDLKHKCGSSSTPQGRHTAVARARVWNDLWALRNMAPRADVFLRGHVHYHQDCGGVRNNRPWRAMTLPALQGPGSKYGVRECEGEVHFGLVVFEVDENGAFTWQVHEFQTQEGTPVARVL